MDLKYYKDKKRKGRRERERRDCVCLLYGKTVQRFKYMPLWARCARTPVNYSETDGEQTWTQADIHRRTLWLFLHDWRYRSRAAAGAEGRWCLWGGRLKCRKVDEVCVCVWWCCAHKALAEVFRSTAASEHLKVKYSEYSDNFICSCVFSLSYIIWITQWWDWYSLRARSCLMNHSGFFYSVLIV